MGSHKSRLVRAMLRCKQIKVTLAEENGDERCWREQTTLGEVISNKLLLRLSLLEGDIHLLGYQLTCRFTDGEIQQITSILGYTDGNWTMSRTCFAKHPSLVYKISSSTLTGNINQHTQGLTSN